MSLTNLFNVANLHLLTATSKSTGVTNSIYTAGNNNLTNMGKKIISLIGGIGGIAFTIAVMVIALTIIFGSIAPKNIGKWWTALFSCVGGAVLFFGAYLLSDVIANLFK